MSVCSTTVSTTIRLGRHGGRLALALLLVGTLLLVPAAHAEDTHKTAQLLAQRATVAFDAGDFDRAGEMFHEAFRADARAGYLFDAARAYQLARNLESAEKLFRAYLEAADRDPAQEAKAREHLKDVRTKAAADKLAEADAAAKSGRHRVAAELYHSALEMAPDRTDILLRAAKAEQAAGDLPGAERDYRTALDRLPAESAERRETTALLQEVREKRGALLAEPRAASPLPTSLQPKAESPSRVMPGPVPAIGPSQLGTRDAARSTPAPPLTAGPDAYAASLLSASAPPAARPSSSIRRPIGWVLFGAGIVAAGTAGYLFATASVDRALLDRELAVKNGQGLIVGLSHDDASAKAQSIADRKTSAAIAVGVGGVGVAVGLILVATGGSSTVAVLPGPSPAGATLAWRF